LAHEPIVAEKKGNAFGAKGLWEKMFDEKDNSHWAGGSKLSD
jgi:hypothetical protein